MVEIGNEDSLGGGCESYAERFTAFYDAIHEPYPDLTLIASTDNVSCLPSDLPEGAWVDYHNYNTADGLVSQFNMFDNKDRSVPYFIGEYSRWEIDVPNMQGSVAEAVFMIGLERNSDVVKMAAYAPLLQLVNSTQWTVRSTTMINFNETEIQKTNEYSPTLSLSLKTRAISSRPPVTMSNNSSLPTVVIPSKKSCLILPLDLYTG